MNTILSLGATIAAFWLAVHFFVTVDNNILGSVVLFVGFFCFVNLLMAFKEDLEQIQKGED